MAAAIARNAAKTIFMRVGLQGERPSLGRLAALLPLPRAHRTHESRVTPPWDVDHAMRRRAPPRNIGNATGRRARLAPGCRA